MSVAPRGRRVLWVVGPALGHAARALVVARALRDAHGVGSRFIGADRHGFHARLLAPEFDTIDTGHTPAQFEAFADAVAAQLVEHRYDALCLDCASVPWRLAIGEPGLPSVYLTNAFLAHATQATHQDLQWREHGASWNARRQARGLPPLANAAALFEADRVLLADPDWILDVDAALPVHHRLTGACAWAPDGPLPDALAGLRDVALIATGSTGTPLPAGFPQALARACGARHVVQVDSQGVRLDGRTLDVGVVPLPALLAHCRVALTHGGAGSTWLALAQGVPVLVWPGHHNHRLLGERIQAAGLGLLLDPQGGAAQLQAFERRAQAMGECARAHAFDLQSGPLRAAGEIVAML
ncbi:glycosyltransferase [Agrilutibacter solisilvae]|uniref:Erythromycin biosynthesis protein CIII-like C-terminal domain-containing protein n=1 Tax=Agrilutibacter solisilvae TaxID=2763317 RepID=A0A974Y309_9GAMM|nr:nucleotide disphospho-sugar-binding domain-containing protein [Lysobacter solisilvae]QSX79698.1 hypothetical protein I8J32_007615 [Lysobacter solisilvae]